MLCKIDLKTAATFAITAAVTLMLFSGSALRSDAKAYTYGVQNHTVNCGIVLLDEPNVQANVMIDANGLGTSANAGANNPVPYLFYVLNSRTDLKPLGWKLDNPFAPHNVTQDIQARWDARTSYDGPGSPGSNFLAAQPGGHAYVLGQEITQNMAPYWEVPMSSMTLASITQYNTLYLRIRPGLPIPRRDAELLLAFVESGGTLWIEGIPNSSISPIDSLFFNTAFSAPQQVTQAFVPVIATGAPTPYPSFVPVRHPIISSPYLLGQDELSQLGLIGVSVTNTDTTNQLADVLLYGGSAGPPVVSSTQYGAGTVTVTTSGCADQINGSIGGLPIIFDVGSNANANAGPYCAVADAAGGASLLTGPLGSGGAADLKLAYNIMSWSGEYNQSQKNSHGNASSEETFTTAIVPQWIYPTALNNSPVAAATIFGHTAYAVDSLGNLHGYDLIPGEHLFGTSDPDDGIPDYDQGTTYDALWGPVAVGTYSSSPIVFVMPKGTSFSSAPPSTPTVAVERADGTISLYNGLTGAHVFDLPNSRAGGTFSSTTGPAPAPTFFAGKIFAGEFNGSGNGAPPLLYEYDFNPATAANSGAAISLYTIPAGQTGNVPVDYPTGAPSIAIMSEGVQQDQSNTTNDIVAYVPTNYGLTTVFLGSRNELLQGGAPIATVRNLGSNSISIDQNTNPKPGGYGVDPSTGYKTVLSTNVTSGPAGFAFTPSPYPGPFYGSYDVDLTSAQSAAATSLSRIHAVRTSAYIFDQGAGVDAVTSTPALDGNGNAFYTVSPDPTKQQQSKPNSSLYCVRDSSNSGARVIKWRFRLPFANESGWNGLDADQVNYALLAGFRFVGAPVADKTGNVWATAYNSTSGQIAILAFNANSVPTADIPGNPKNIAAVQVQQPYPYDTTSTVGTEFSPADPVLPLNPAQFAFNNRGHIDFNNYGASSGNPTVEIYANLSEPEPVQVSYTIAANGAAVPGAKITIPVHSNMSWYTILPGTYANVTGLNRVGDYLYFGTYTGQALGGIIGRVYAYPYAAGAVDNQRFANPLSTDPNGQQVFTVYGNLGINSVAAPLAIANGRMVAVGYDSIAALGNQPTLVADNNRLVEFDSDGNATWSVDTTSSALSQPRVSGVITAASVKFNRPSAISQLSANDYLVVDTGNNRVVQIDRGGHVLWEVNRFNPGTAALAPGTSTRLNQPTGCEVVKTYDPATQNTVVHYLIADSGNFRVVEISDTYNNKGALLGLPHQLTWVSHTFDSLGRKYRYQSASYYTDQSGNQFVAALVTNARISQRISPGLTPPLGQQNNAAQDGQGASIVLMDYANSATQASGYISYRQVAGNWQMQVTSQLAAPLQSDGQFSFNNGPLTQIPLHNPRFLQVYTNVVAGTITQSFLLAQDNGVFDMHYNGGFVADWGFTAADYQTVGTPLDAGNVASKTPFSRALLNPFSPPAGQTGIPFQAACLQRLERGKYLVTNSFSLGDSLPAGIGNYPANYPLFKGEALVVSTPILNGTLTGPTKEIHDLGLGVYSGHTFAIPSNTGQLTQPLYAIRPL